MRPARPTRSNSWRYRCRRTWAPSPARRLPGVNRRPTNLPHGWGVTAPADLFDDEPPAETRKAPGVEGHRHRLRERLLAAGPDALADHEMLEVLLFALPRRDTKALARALIARFGSFARAISAPVQELVAVEGLGEAGAAALKSVHAAALRLMRAEVVGQPVLTNWDRLIEYLNAVLSRERIEQF